MGTNNQVPGSNKNRESGVSAKTGWNARTAIPSTPLRSSELIDLQVDLIVVERILPETQQSL